MSTQVRAVVSLALLYAFRMLGLFMVLPVLVLYGADYRDATPFLLGLALGVYGLSQGVLQVPLGLLSDIVGRKPVIIGGLLVFALGSLIAASSTSVYGLVLGRVLQGSGAIASTVMALVADLTSEQHRTKAMAAIGASIGLSFSVAMIIGPALAAAGGLKAVFLIAMGLAILGLLVVIWMVPTPKQVMKSHRDSGAIPDLIFSTAQNTQLLRLNFGVFVLHLVLMACFVSVPSLLEQTLGLSRDDHWMVYFPVLVLAFVVMFPFILISEKRKQVKPVLLAAILLLCLSILGMAILNQSWIGVLAAIFGFFVAFNLLEASLPSLVSKISPVGAKGTAMGLYSTSQFLGAFVGGAGGGWLVQAFGVDALFYCCALVVLCWLAIAFSMDRPKYLSSLCLPAVREPQEMDVLSVPGVEEVLWVAEESLLYLKVNKDVLDRGRLDRLLDNCI